MADHVPDEPEGERSLSRRAGDAATVQRVFEQLPLMVCSLAGPQPRFVAATGAYRAFAARENVTGMDFLDAFPEV